MSVIGNGLRDAWQDFALPSWGGRAALDNPVVYPNHYTDLGLSDDGEAWKLWWRWLPAAQNDFAARMDWTVAENYADANHQPKVVSATPLRQVVQAGAWFH